MVIEDDDNLLSVLQYALFFLGVKRIVLSGHYGCGGVEAAQNLPGSVLDGQESALARRIQTLRHDIQHGLAESPLQTRSRVNSSIGWLRPTLRRNSPDW